MTDNKNIAKPSKVEAIKENSNYLRDPIIADLADDKDYVSNESYELLKFHGTYQQYDRDTATALKKQGLAKEHSFMIRMRMPGGRLTGEQYLAIDKIADKYTKGSMRITTRETFQLHCVTKGNLKKTIAEINAIALSTLGGCGDVTRNMTTASAPYKNTKYDLLMQETLKFAEYFAPKTKAYNEIWLDEDNLATQENTEEIEPLYGKKYMPRKYKIGIGIPEDNSFNVLSNDLAIIAIFDDNDKLQGYNIAIGGGLGMTHNKPETYPRLATPIFFVEAEDLIKVSEAIVILQRDFGDRSNRKRARLKYVIDDNGIDWCKEQIQATAGKKFAPPVPVEFKIKEHLGWHEQGDGKLFLGVPISSGRIIDREKEQIRTGLREIIAKYKTNLVLTTDQNIILCDIAPSDKENIIKDLKFYGIKLLEDISPIYRHTLACVALPTCGKALAEAERVKLPLIAEFDELANKHNIADEEITISISGCPNGCSRSYSGDIGIVGRMPDHYAIYLGGDFEFTRLNSKILDRVPTSDIKIFFDCMFGLFVKERNVKERFGDFCHRLGMDAVLTYARTELSSDYKWLA